MSVRMGVQYQNELCHSDNVLYKVLNTSMNSTVQYEIKFSTKLYTSLIATGRPWLDPWQQQGLLSWHTRPSGSEAHPSSPKVTRDVSSGYESGTRS